MTWEIGPAGNSFDGAEHPVERRTGIEFASIDQCGNLFRVGDVVERIGVEQHEVGSFSFFDRAGILFRAEEASGIEGGGLQSLHGRESSLD